MTNSLEFLKSEANDSELLEHIEYIWSRYYTDSDVIKSSTTQCCVTRHKLVNNI